MKNFKDWLFLKEEDDDDHYGNDNRKKVSNLLEDAEDADSVKKILTTNNIKYNLVTLNSTEFLSLPRLGLIVYDFTEGYPSVDSIIDFLHTNDAEEFKDVEDFNEKFWEYPIDLYHATTKENWQSIKKNGINPMCKTRGIGNKSVKCAVFTTTEKESLMDGAYGDIIIKIDTHKMKMDSKTPLVSKEPEIEEYDSNMLLAHKLGFRIQLDIPSDIYPNTVIVHEEIPVKYITLTM